MKKKNLIGWCRDLTIMALIVLGISAWQSRNMLQADGTVAVNQYQLVSMQGNVQSLTQPGKRTLVYFFAPWCNICKLSINNLDYLSSEDLHVVRVALDYRDKSEVLRFVDENEVNGEVLLGTHFHKEAFQIKGYPSYYLLDQDNNIVSRSFGYSTALGLKLTDYLNSN